MMSSVLNKQNLDTVVISTQRYSIDMEGMRDSKRTKTVASLVREEKQHALILLGRV